jgi:hypothetical protein
MTIKIDIFCSGLGARDISAKCTLGVHEQGMSMRNNAMGKKGHFKRG